MTSIDRIVEAADKEKHSHKHDDGSARGAEIMAYLAAAREGIVMALEAIDDRAKEENYTVCPGMWFAAGYVRKTLLPGFDALNARGGGMVDAQPGLRGAVAVRPGTESHSLGGSSPSHATKAGE